MNYVAIMYLHAIINRIQCFHDNKTWVRNFLTVRRQIPGQPEPQVSPAASRAQWSGGVFGPWPCYWASSDPTSSSSGPHPLMSTSICQQFGKLMIHLEESMHFYWVKRTKKVWIFDLYCEVSRGIHCFSSHWSTLPALSAVNNWWHRNQYVLMQRVQRKSVHFISENKKGFLIWTEKSKAWLKLTKLNILHILFQFYIFYSF